MMDVGLRIGRYTQSLICGPQPRGGSGFYSGVLAFGTPASLSASPHKKASIVSSNEQTNSHADMTSQYRHTPPEVNAIDMRIARLGGTSFTMELQAHRLREVKSQEPESAHEQVKRLLRENGHLRQEIVFYQESRNAMMEFHSRLDEAYRIQRQAFHELSNQMALAEARLEKYWGPQVNLGSHSDLSVL